MTSIIRYTPFSLNDGGAIVKTILGILFLGILCSMVHLVFFPNPSELSKAEVNIDFGDSGDSITASATIRVEAPVDEQDDTTTASTLPPSLLDISIPDVSLPSISIPDISLQTPSLPSPSLPKCCQDWNPDCSWLEHMVEVICKFREDAWNMMVQALLSIRDILKRMLSLICDFLALILTNITSLIQYVDCNISSNPWEGCSSKLLRDTLDILDAKDKIFLSWIPVESSTTNNGLSMVSKILTSIATMLGFLIIIILCIFFENSPEKDQIVQKIKDVFGNAQTEPSVDESDEKDEGQSKKMIKQKEGEAVREPSKKRNKSKLKKKIMKKKPKQTDKTQDTIARNDKDINTEG